jgi:hypothetical protein
MLHIKTEYSGSVAVMAKGQAVTTRWFRGLIKNAYEVTLDFWHKKIRPKHFQVSAMGEYGYAPRKPSYQKSKGHRRPLYYTGDSMRATEQNYIKVSGVGASLHMGAGNLAWHPGGLDMRDELTRTTDADEKAMANVAEESIVHQLRHQTARFTQHIR